MKTKVRDAGDAKIIEVTGKFIFGTESNVADMVKDLILIQSKKMVEAKGGKIVLVKPKKQIALRPLWETLMLEYFDAYDGELAAVGSI